LGQMPELEVHFVVPPAQNNWDMGFAEDMKVRADDMERCENPKIVEFRAEFLHNAS